MTNVLDATIGSDPSAAALRARAVKKFKQNNSNWKTRSLLLFKKHVKEIVSRDPLIKGTTDKNVLNAWFFEHCNVDQLSDLFPFAKKYISIPRSTPRAKSYLRNIYAFLATFIKLHLDWKARDGNINDMHNEENLHNFYKTMALDTIFDEVSAQDFYQIPRDDEDTDGTTTQVTKITAQTFGFSIHDPHNLFCA